MDVVPAAELGSRETHLAREPNRLVRFLKILGPGIVVGASDDDPSGVGTYAMAGAAMGFSMLWTTLVTYPMMTAVQYICAKIGLVSGKGLSAVLRQHYPRPLVYGAVIALVVANTINAGADIGAIAAAFNLLIPVSVVALIVPIALVLLALQIWGSYRTIAAVFKWLSLAFSHISALRSSLIRTPSKCCAGTFPPHIHWDARSLTMLVAILGTTISPYMFFWQANQEVEEDIALGRKYHWQRKGTTDAELTYAAWDVNVGMLFSNVVAYFIMLGTAATLFKAGQTHIRRRGRSGQSARTAGRRMGVRAPRFRADRVGFSRRPRPHRIIGIRHVRSLRLEVRLEQEVGTGAAILWRDRALHAHRHRAQFPRHQPDRHPLLDGGDQRHLGAGLLVFVMLGPTTARSWGHGSTRRS